MKRLQILIFSMLFFVLGGQAKEGMWIPTLLKKYNIEEMQKMGFRLSAEDIYSVNHASMKDAVVLFGRGCTGELISNEGLLMTNHHCGLSYIQSHSTVSNDFLTEGFWAGNREEELINPGLSVKFLVYMADVTADVLEGISDTMDVTTQRKLIAENTKHVKEDATTATHYVADVKPIFYGNQYFIYVYEEFKDVRLVGAPPASVGKFGGDTDNWMWPRHTGDFSLFRIYADKDNKPAEYSSDNVPYQPKKFFPISLKGIQPEDFTMVFGYPGSTQEYLPSQAVDLIMNQSDPEKVAIRTEKLNILSRDMQENRKVRIQYASKYARTSNAWKKWQGEIKGLKRLDAVQVKLKGEAQFAKWVEADEQRKEKYGEVLPNFEKLYDGYAEYQHAYDYYNEILRSGTDILGLAQQFEKLEKALATSNSARIVAADNNLSQYLKSYFRNYNQPTDEKVFSALLNLYRNDLKPDFLPQSFLQMPQLPDTDKFIEKVYRKSLLTDSVMVKRLASDLSTKNLKKLQKDPVYALYKSLKKHYDEMVMPVFRDMYYEIRDNQKVYMAGLMEMNAEKAMMADANLTLRVSYGKVEGFEPRDGVVYKHYTTLEGIMEKDNPEIYDYNVPESLRQLYRDKEYGIFANADGTLPVAFCASNHTTGGNSGSPVVDADGNLIGVNFDRCWEGTMSDIMFDPKRCRNITLDIRYALFLIDKLGNAGHLLDEMELIK